MNDFDVFRQEMSPALTLIDVSGRRHRIAGLDAAAHAIRTADELHALGGAKRVKLAGGEGATIDEAKPFLIYYQSNALQASSREIARAARIIARSEVTISDLRSKICKISGTRALAYADRANPNEGRVCFLVSQLVWYNHNRATIFPPSRVIDGGQDQAVNLRSEDQDGIGAFLADVNGRLEEGMVSFPR